MWCSAFSIANPSPHDNLQDWCLDVRCSCVACHYLVSLIILLLIYNSIIVITGIACMIYVYGYPIWTRDLWFLKLSYLGAAIAPFPRCCYLCTVFLNIELKMLPSDAVMLNLYFQQGHFTWVFQAMQLIVIAVFGAIDQYLASCMLVHFLKFSYKR